MVTGLILIVALYNHTTIALRFSIFSFHRTFMCASIDGAQCGRDIQRNWTMTSNLLVSLVHCWKVLQRVWHRRRTVQELGTRDKEKKQQCSC